MRWEKCVFSSSEFILTKRIGYRKYTGGTIIPESIIELRLTGEFVCTDQHRSKHSCDLFFWCIDRVHIHLIVPIVGSQFNEICLSPYDILDLILVQYTPESIKRFSSLLAEFR